jgi:long-chain fatty acid transport protein
MPRITTKAALLASVLAACVMTAGHANAESFALNEYSALDQGRANAGAAVQTDDASAAFANPALMTLFSQPTFTGVLSSVTGDSERFHNQGSVDLTGVALGNDAQDFLDDGLIPALHVVYPIDNGWTLGLAITAPFGLATSYDPSWPGRHQALESELITINVNPSAAYQITDTLSIGLGVNAQYSQATLSNAIDFGAICYTALGASTCAGLSLTPQAADGRATVEGDDWSFGYNLGVAWAPKERWRFGVAYRSEIDHELKGDADFTAPPAAAPLMADGLFADSGARARLELPATLQAGVKWRAGDRITLYGDIRERYWSRFDEIRVQFANPLQPDAVEQVHYKDATRYAVGLDFQLNDEWIVRGGYAYDETPTNKAYRTARIADDSRRYYAMGVSWTAPDNWRVDAAYNRVQVADNTYDRVGRFGDRVRGEFEGAANVLSIGVTRRLGARN